MRFTFTLANIKPFSVNALYYGDNKTKTQAYYDWSFQIFSRLAHEDIQQGLKEMSSQFNIKEHGYVVRLTAYYPLHLYYRQIGGVSARTMDLSNWEKPFVDALFLPKNHKQPPPYGSPNLNIDDRYIISLNSRKLPTESEECSIKVQLALAPLPEPFRVMIEQDPHQESRKEDLPNQPDE